MLYTGTVDYCKLSYSFKKEWLSDPGAYPIMVIMGGGLAFMVGMGFNALFGYKDVQINPNKRGSFMRTWGQEEQRGVVHRIVDAKGRVNAGPSEKRRRRTTSVQVQVDRW